MKKREKRLGLRRVKEEESSKEKRGEGEREREREREIKTKNVRRIILGVICLPAVETLICSRRHDRWQWSRDRATVIEPWGWEKGGERGERHSIQQLGCRSVCHSCLNYSRIIAVYRLGEQSNRGICVAVIKNIMFRFTSDKSLFRCKEREGERTETYRMYRTFAMKLFL